MLRKLALALAFTSLIALPTPGMAGHGGGGHGGFHGGGGHGGYHGGGYHGYRGGYRGGYGVYRGGGAYGGGGRYWRGRYWAYGVGPCWNWNPFFGGWAWTCY